MVGVDTSSTTMAAMAHYLSCTDKAYRQAVEEVRAAFDSVEEIQLGKSSTRACSYEPAWMKRYACPRREEVHRGVSSTTTKA